MRLFEIDARIMACVDMETGEITDEELFNSLEMERDEKIENLACLVKNLTADAEAFKVQKQAFAERQKKQRIQLSDLKRKYLLVLLVRDSQLIRLIFLSERHLVYIF